ncbi:helix-turn-helix domain-containing protein [Candidatus Gottesmanbacteria bacterium]|nr:helix-turn-helix domain-containing protein [Candidatus Gottesmanbacteria bacterium]
MTTVGEILSAAREKKKLTIEQVEKATRIRSKFLLALEKNEFNKLPPGTFTRGFIKNYAAFLNLPEEEILAFYRRQENFDKTPPPLKSLKPSRFPSLTFSTLAVIVLIALFFGYLIYSYLKFAGSPTLIINSPGNNSVVSQEQTEITGKTDPEAKLTINDQPVIINENGSFNITIPLQPGLNTLTVIATNKFKRQTTVTRNLRLEK